MRIPADETDISDPTDWLDTPLKGLMPVEQTLRCHVCKDFYNSPLLTSCNHTFCSLCIRRCLSHDGKCPFCRAPDQEMKLRGNWALREAVEAFCSARSQLLDTARKIAAAAAAATPAESTPSAKRKTRSADADREDPDFKRTRRSTRASKARSAEATAAIMRDEVLVIPDSDEEKVEEEPPDDGLVACPICNIRMKEVQVSRHLDTSCPGEPQPQRPRTTQPRSSAAFGSLNSTTQATNNPPDRLPSLNYSILNDNALRKKMNMLGLNASGPRKILESRHREWVTIWNANCDSARPKKRSELFRDLDEWERTQGSRVSTSSRAANLGAQIKDREFDGMAWAAKHESGFKDLIANARESRLKAQEKQEEAKAEAEKKAAEAGEKGAGDGQESVDKGTPEPFLTIPPRTGAGSETPSPVQETEDPHDLTRMPSMQEAFQNHPAVFPSIHPTAVREVKDFSMVDADGRNYIDPRFVPGVDIARSGPGYGGPPSL